MRVKIFTVLALAAALFLSACGKSDADLQKAASEKLIAEKVAGVSVAVKDGVATLTGEVADITVKSKADASVKTVDGIKSVTNNITIKTQQPTAEPPQSDAVKKGLIDEALKKMGISGVTVAVKDGVATLTGTIPKDRLAEATKAALEADVTKVDNQLKTK